jgi:inner membrane transporter RhtA
VTNLIFPIITLLIAMVSLQGGASLAKQLFPLVGTVGAAGLRLSLATLILFIVWRPWRGKLTRKEFYSVSLYGFSLGFMNLFFYMALERIPLGIGVALEFTGPLAVSLASSRRVSDFTWVAFTIIGILLLMPTSASSNPLDLIGVAYGLAAGAGWALYIIFGQRAGASMSSGRTAALGMFMGSLVVLPLAIVQEGSKLFSLSILPLAFFVALISSAFPYTLEMIVLKKLPAKTFGILSSLEPAMAAVSGLFFLNEHLSFVQWLAIGLIILASFGSSISVGPKAGNTCTKGRLTFRWKSFYSNLLRFRPKLVTPRTRF